MANLCVFPGILGSIKRERERDGGELLSFSSKKIVRLDWTLQN